MEFLSIDINAIKKQVWENRLKFMVGLLIFLIGFLSILISGPLLNELFPDPVRPQDLILDNVNELTIFIMLGEIFAFINVLFFAYSQFKTDLKQLPAFLVKYGILTLLRSFTIFLTPLAQIQDPTENATAPIVGNIYYGMFFSGHTSGAFLMAFEQRWNKKIRRVMLVLSSLVGISLILSHSHYSIDVMAAPFIAYAISSIDVDGIWDRITNNSKSSS